MGEGNEGGDGKGGGVLSLFFTFFTALLLYGCRYGCCCGIGVVVCFVVVDSFDYSIMGLLLFCRSMVHGY